MTRKQALHKALEIISKLEQTEELQEVRSKLEEVIGELPISHWSAETIHDTFAQFRLEHGRNATLTDLKSKELPSHTTIKNRFKMNAKEFLATYYPPESNSRIYSQYSREKLKSDFIEQYHRLKAISSEYYDSNRAKSTPQWILVARMYGISKWL